MVGVYILHESKPLKTGQPKDLIQNGFVYAGVGDKVMCFYSNVTLKQWEKDDCIETEHLKWEPNCLFAKMVSNKCHILTCFLYE